MLPSELGTVPPVADMKQETIILMLHKRIEILKEKLEDAENTRTQALTAGTFCMCIHYVYTYVCTSGVKYFIRHETTLFMNVYVHYISQL